MNESETVRVDIGDPESFDCVIVGAGFAGSTVARELAERGGKRILLLEAREHIGGNAYDCLDEAGILIHRYGPHIFHTNDERVFSYLSRFTEWRDYQHEVLADVHGKYMPVPFNKQSLRVAFGEERAKELISKLISVFGDERKVPIIELREQSDPELAEVADYVYDNVFLRYTQKQWGLAPDEVDPSVTARVPVFISEDSRYFQDTFQGMPLDGYTPLFDSLLNHEGITVRTGIDARKVLAIAEDGEVELLGKPFAGPIIYTGPLDELFDCRYGRLPYRSLDFDFETLDYEWFQLRGTINYTVSEDFTRITEFKYLTGQVLSDKTTIMREYPCAYEGREGQVPYYAIIDDENRAHYERYLALTQACGDFHPLGRLAEYRYYNMDVIVARALELADELLSREA